MKPVKLVMAEMLLDREPILVPEVWKDLLEDLWSGDFNRCPVCKDVFCHYEVYRE